MGEGPGIQLSRMHLIMSTRYA